MPHSTLGTTVSPTASITRSVSFLLFLIGWTAALATVLAFFGTVWWPLDMLADWRFSLAVVLVITAVASGLGYSRVSAVVFLTAALINIWLVAPLWLDEQPQFTSSDRLRVVSLDIGSAPDVREAVMDWVNLTEGDIVVLANAGGTWARSIEQLEIPYRVVTEDPGLTGGTVVLARNGIPVTVEDRPIRLGAVDVVVSVSLGGQELTIVGLSVERPVSAGASGERIEDFTAINAGIHRMSGSTVIVGNLEASRWSHAFSAIAAGLTNSEDGFGYLSTFPSFDWPFLGDYMGIPVDHALYTGPITVTNRRVSPDLGTDHRAIVVDLSPADG